MFTNMKGAVEIGDSHNGVSVGKFLPTFEGSSYSLHLEAPRSPTALSDHKYRGGKLRQNVSSCLANEIVQCTIMLT